MTEHWFAFPLQMLLLKWSQNYFQVKSKAALTNISKRPEKRDIVNVFHLVALLYPKIQDRISAWEGFTTHRTGPRYKQGNVGHTVQLVFPTNDSEIPNCPTKPQPHSHPQSGHDRSICFQIGAVKQQNQSAQLCGTNRHCPGGSGAARRTAFLWLARAEEGEQRMEPMAAFCQNNTALFALVHCMDPRRSLLYLCRKEWR